MDVLSEDNGLIALFEEQYVGYRHPDTMLLALSNRLREQGFVGLKLTHERDLASLEGPAAEAARKIIPTLQLRASDSAAASLL